MSRKKIVAGNWKMNLDYNEAIALINNVINASKTIINVEKIIFPPFPFLQIACDMTKNETNFFIGAQNCSEHISGAFTGEVSANMINSIGCSHVLIGHSERRLFFKETDGHLILKIKHALNHNLHIIYCVGEQLEERKNALHFDVVRAQLENVLNNFNELDLEKIYIAYEPVWAIGTGETATPEQAQEIHAYIRRVINKNYSAEVAEKINILYGGSCNSKNAKELFSCKDIDGGLIGGASLKADEFCKIMLSF